MEKTLSDNVSRNFTLLRNVKMKNISFMKIVDRLPCALNIRSIGQLYRIQVHTMGMALHGGCSDIGMEVWL